MNITEQLRQLMTFDNIQSFKETLYQDFINFKDKPYGYE